MNSTLVKIILFCFAALALYNYNKPAVEQATGTAKEVVSQASELLKYAKEPEKKSAIVAQANDNSSFVGNTLANVINNVLETKKGKEILESTITGLSNNSDKLKSILKKNFTYQDSVTGTGPEVTCGQEVVVTFSAPTSPPGVAAKLHQTQTTRLGSGTLSQALEAAIVGMKKGGKRYITFAKENIDPIGKKQPTMYYSEVELIESLPATNTIITQPIFSKADPDTVVESILDCGNMVIFHYTIHDMNNKLLYDSKLTNTQSQPLRIGSNQMPHIISKNLSNLNSNHKLYVTIPASELVNFGFIKIPQQILDEKNVVILTLEPRKG